jgi:hypothetical protein
VAEETSLDSLLSRVQNPEHQGPCVHTPTQYPDHCGCFGFYAIISTPLRGRRPHEPRGPSLAGALNWLSIDLEHRTCSIGRRGFGCWAISRHEADEGKRMRGLGLYKILLNPLGLDHPKKEMPGSSRISMETEP